MGEAVFVDASAPSVRSDDGMTVLLPTTSPGYVFYAARTARMATGTKGRYVLSLVRRRKREEHKPGGAARVITRGGAVAAQVELAALLPSSLDESAWIDALRRSGVTPPVDCGFTFLPLPTWQGRMTLGGLTGFVDTRTPYEGVPIGAATAVPVTVRLNPRGADAFRKAVAAGGGPPVAVRIDYDYDIALPRCAYRLTADARAAHAVFGHHATAVAGCYGTAGGQAELDAMSDELRSSGAVRISWELAPEGFDTVRLAAMESAVIERWAKCALDQMVDSVEPDPDAPGGACGLGHVVVTLRDVASVENLDLSERREGQRIVRETFSHSINLGQLRGLQRDDYAVDVEDDDAVPLVLNFGRDSRVQRYVCHHGYRRGDGTVIGGSHEATGSEGLSVVDLIRWGSGEARPETVEIRFSVEWADLQWESQTGKAVLGTDVPCIAFSVNPGAGIAGVALVSDLASAEVGSFATVNWYATLPPVGEEHPKNYAGSFLIEGAGAEGRLVREVATFPYQSGQEATTIFEWSADLAMPDGAVLSGKESFSLAERNEAEIFRDNLRSA
jgi:hypothetical protein